MRHVLGYLLLHYYLITVLMLISIKIAESFDMLRTKFKQINFTKQLQPATKCAEGRIASYEYELDPKAVTFVEGMLCYCQVIIFHKLIREPEYGRNANWKLYDVIARPAYVPIGHFQGVTPFCVTGQRSTVCYCSGNGCFWDAWSVVDFLLQTYRFNTASKAGKLDNYRFDDYSDDRKFRINALQSVTSGLRKSFHFHNLLPEIPIPSDSALDNVDSMLKLWNRFDKEKKKLFDLARNVADRVGSLDDNDDDDGEENNGETKKKQKKKRKDGVKKKMSTTAASAVGDESKNKRIGNEDESGERAKKSKKRLFYVIVFMGGLNALSFLLILIFFTWYKCSSNRAVPEQITEEIKKDLDDSESKKTPAMTPQKETPAAQSPALPNAPAAAAPSPGPNAGPAPPQVLGGAVPPPPEPGGAFAKPGAPPLPQYPVGADQLQWPQTY